ncbi:hypothetical protein FACS1894211_11850 [Clostridia bacterium]|nr:hypothetical protein FACS1894211_11850 [Clostridia bacterium]
MAMKKKLPILICFLLTAALVFSACAYRNDGLTDVEKDYAVTGNGGQAVQYGDYIYFINGTIASFDDSDGTHNKWGEVEKGGIYRVKLQGGTKKAYQYDVPTDKDGKVPEAGSQEPVWQKHKTDLGVPGAGRMEYYPNIAGELNVYDKDASAFPVRTLTDTSFPDRDKTDGDIEKITFIDSASIERVVPKVITFSGDSSAGFFIYEGYIYYATYSNRRSTGGSVEYTLTEFYRTRTDGQKTQLLYASSEAVTQYNVYRYDGKTYIVMHEGGTLRSVSVDGRGRVRKKALETEVTEVFFPRKSVYYIGINENTLSDFVFYTRAIDIDDNDVSGNVLETRRPDLAELSWGELPHLNQTFSVAGVSDNTLFYYMTPSSGVKSLYAQDYSAQVTGNKPAALNPNERDPELPTAALVIPSAESVAQVNVYMDGAPIALGVEDGNLVKYQPDAIPVPITEMSGTILGIYHKTVYFDESGALYSTELYWDADKLKAGEKIKITDKSISTDNNFGVDIVGDLIFFLVSTPLEQKDFAFEINEGLTDYMYCKLSVGARASDDEYFVGVIDAGDQPEEE